VGEVGVDVAQLMHALDGFRRLWVDLVGTDEFGLL
jgi:hypothetical protein